MTKLKIMAVVGTRPEVIKLSRIIHELDNYTNFIFVHTGQNFDYELNEIFFEDLNIKQPDYLLNCAGKSAAITIGNVMIKVDKIFEVEKPDAVIIYGDTNSCLCAIAAKRRKIPIFHLEAGNRSFDQRIPEEINRKIIDHISDINLTISQHAKKYLIKEGLRPETIFNIGSPMKEIFHFYRDKILESPILEKLNLVKGEYFVVSLHREENINSEFFETIIKILNTIAEKYGKRVIVSTHPRFRSRLNHETHPNIYFLNPFGFFAYIKLQLNAYCVISDSGSITEDASILNIPAVTLREAHERPEGFDVGTLVMSGVNPERVLQSIDLVINQHNEEKRNFKLIPDYDVENVSKKVLRIITSYIDYINRTIWYKKNC